MAETWFSLAPTLAPSPAQGFLPWMPVHCRVLLLCCHPPHLKTTNMLFSADKTGEMQLFGANKIEVMNIQDRVVKLDQNFGGERETPECPCHLSPLLCLSKFPLSESLLSPLKTDLPKTLSHHLTSAYLLVSDLPQSRGPSPVNQLRRRLLFPKLRRFSFASTNQSPQWVGGPNCAGQ